MSDNASYPGGDLTVTIVLPSGGARTAEVPDDVAVRDLLSELTSLLKLPTLGPDGRPMSYRVDSKASAASCARTRRWRKPASRPTIV